MAFVNPVLSVKRELSSYFCTDTVVAAQWDFHLTYQKYLYLKWLYLIKVALTNQNVLY